MLHCKMLASPPTHPAHRGIGKDRGVLAQAIEKKAVDKRCTLFVQLRNDC
jgi:hypothetical protein